MKLEYPPGATPLSVEEIAELLPRHVTVQGQLNELEEANILQATEWLLARRRGNPLDERFIHTVHRRMFGDVWRWAGKVRTSDKNLGVPWFEIPAALRILLADVQVQIAHASYEPLELAARFHHRLVAIHLYPNGNGRHARIMADVLARQLTGTRINWGANSLTAPDEHRLAYIRALQSADRGNYQPLLEFLSLAP